MCQTYDRERRPDAVRPHKSSAHSDSAIRLKFQVATTIEPDWFACWDKRTSLYILLTTNSETCRTLDSFERTSSVLTSQVAALVLRSFDGYTARTQR